MASDSILTKLPETSYHEESIPVDSKEFYKALDSRRSVRKFDATPIPQEVVNRCLDAAMRAPNSSNLQAWEFHWVRSENKKQLLKQACLSQPTAMSAAELVVFVARTNTWRTNVKLMIEMLKKRNDTPKSAMFYYEKLIPLVMTQGPLSIIGFFKRIVMFIRGLKTPTPREPVSNTDVKIWAIKSCALACENYMLAMRAEGFDTCPMEGFDSSRVRKLLNLPRGAEIVMVISAGKRAPGGIYGRQIRFDRNKFVVEH